MLVFALLAFAFLLDGRGICIAILFLEGLRVIWSLAGVCDRQEIAVVGLCMLLVVF